MTVAATRAWMLELAAYCRCTAENMRNPTRTIALKLKPEYPILYMNTVEEIDAMAADYEEKAKGI